ncbi:MAG: DJ-1/PfpI family protein [Fibrobacter sp.]|nr:DJ-1/PfpI family protein [Fibrobacter sp.]
MQILVLLADGFEETEFVVPVDLWRRAGFKVTVASVSGADLVDGLRGLKIQSDEALSKLNPADFDGVFLPGGGVGVRNLKASAEVERIVCDFNDQNKWVLAICAAPTVLSKARILLDRRVTCYPGCEAELVCREFSEDRVVVDGNIITSRGPGTAEEFALKCIAALGGAELALTIQKQIVAR